MTKTAEMTYDEPFNKLDTTTKEKGSNGSNGDGHDTMSVADLRRQYAERYGVELDRVSTVRLELRKLQETGTLVDLDFHGGNMFTVRATYDELGIPAGDVRRKRLKAGSKDLLPKKLLGRLRSIETRFRQSLEKHSFKVGAFGSYRWVPYTAYEQWREDWDKLQAELTAWKEEVLARYDEFIGAIADDFAQVAHEAWQAILARRSGDVDFVLVTRSGDKFGGDQKDLFVAHVVNRAIAKMPTRDEIEHDLHVDYRTAVLLSQADVEADRLIADRFRHQRELEAAQAWDERTRIIDERRNHQQQLWAEEEETRLHLKEKRNKLATMRQAELEHARQQLQQMGSPLQEVFDSLRAQMFADVSDVLAGIKKNGRLVGRSAERVRNLVQTFRLLNAHEDDQLEAALDELQSRLVTLQRSDKETRDVGVSGMVDQLEQIKILTHEAAVAVKKRMGPSRFAHLEV